MMSRIHPVLFWTGVVVILVVSLYVLSPILLPFVVGMLLAYLLNPPVARLSRLGVGRTWASLLVLVLSFVIFIGVMLLILPMLQQQIADLIGQLPKLVTLTREKVTVLLALIQDRLSPETTEKIQESVGGVAGDLAGNLAKLLGGLIAGIWSSGFALVNLLSLLFITPLVAFYLLNDWERIVAAVDSYIPRRHLETVRGLARDIDAHLAGYVRGVSLICLILALFYASALTLIGLDFGLVIGLLSGLISFIPFVGALFGFVISVGLALVQFSEWSSVLLVAGVFVFGQIIEGNVLQPWLVGRQVNLHPVWIIFALLAGGTVFGFLGVLLAVPIAVVISVLIRFALRRYRESALFREAALPAPPKPPVIPQPGPHPGP